MKPTTLTAISFATEHLNASWSNVNHRFTIHFNAPVGDSIIGTLRREKGEVSLTYLPHTNADALPTAWTGELYQLISICESVWNLYGTALGAF